MTHFQKRFGNSGDGFFTFSQTIKPEEVENCLDFVGYIFKLEVDDGTSLPIFNHLAGDNGSARCLHLHEVMPL